MFNPTGVVASSFGDYLADLYLEYFSGRKHDYAALIGGAAKLMLERLGNSDALYHNAEHTIMVTLVGQQIIRGRLFSEAVRPADWLHYTFALLAHDIGYVRGACKGDQGDEVVINGRGEKVTVPRGASDAWLAPWHVDRGMIYVRERFADVSLLDQDRLARAIDYTRFPVPPEARYAETDGEPALVRAADLIGQLGDPHYPRKANALYYEFVETGLARQLGYETPADVLEKYPEFFWSQVQPLIGPAIRHLDQTVEGKQWIAQMYNHVFQEQYHMVDDVCVGPAGRQRGS